MGDDPQLDLNFGPLDDDRQQNFVLSGRVEVPRTGGLTVSGIYRWMSGMPLTLINSAVDADRNGRLFDELPAGNYCGVGLNAFCVDYEGGPQRREAARVPADRHEVRLPVPSGQGHHDRRELRVVQPLQHWNFSNPGAPNDGASIVDQRLTDFLILTAFNGGNGQPRAAAVQRALRLLINRFQRRTHRTRRTKQHGLTLRVPRFLRAS